MNQQFSLTITGTPDELSVIAQAIAELKTSTASNGVATAMSGVRVDRQPEQSNAPTIKSAAIVPAATSAVRPAMEDARAVLAELVRQGKKPEVKALLQEFGAGKLVDVPAENLGELLSKARAIN